MPQATGRGISNRRGDDRTAPLPAAKGATIRHSHCLWEIKTTDRGKIILAEEEAERLAQFVIEEFANTSVRDNFSDHGVNGYCSDSWRCLRVGEDSSSPNYGTAMVKRCPNSWQILAEGRGQIALTDREIATLVPIIQHSPLEFPEFTETLTS